MVKRPPASAGDVRGQGFIPQLGRSPGGGHGTPPQYSCLENPTDRGAWRATVHRLTMSWTRLKQLACMHAKERDWSLGEQKVKMKVAQSCPTLCDPMDCIVHGVLQARILEWVAFPFSRGSSPPRDRTQVSGIADRFFTS